MAVAFPNSPVTQKVKDSPTLDTDSASIAALLGDAPPVLDLIEYGNSLYVAGSETRYAVAATGGTPSPFGDAQCPLDASWTGTAGDGHMIVIDGDNVWSFYEYDWNAGAPTCTWGGIASLSGSTVTDSGTGHATGSGFSLLAGLITRDDLLSGSIDHALVFSSNMATADAFVPPAKRTDGSNMSGAAYTITEGQRVQLDPSVDISGLTGHSKMIAKALQEYGAYCIDNGGGRMAFMCERPTGIAADDYTITDTAFTSVGIDHDYKTVYIKDLIAPSLSVLDGINSEQSGGSPILPDSPRPLQWNLQRLSGTSLDSQGAANSWAGTTGLDLLAALNHKNGTTGLGLLAVLNELAGTSKLGVNAAASKIEE